ncbi:hypothetical protein ACK3TF_005366 [Chlorella vulgaris]
MARISLLAGLLLVLCVSHAAADEVLDCQADFTYPRSSYPIRAGKFKEVVKGNFINRAFDVAVKTATVRMKEEGLIRLTCKPTWTKKVYGCFNSVKPGTMGKQITGMYAFKYRVEFTCLRKDRIPFSVRRTILQNVYTKRDGTYWSATHGLVW